MAWQGAVISEFPMRTIPDRPNFPRRNRLISGLSLAVVVMEADEKSGALITAKHAAEQGKDVFAVPGSIFSELSKGAHRLLKDGARPVESAADVIDALELFRPLRCRRRPASVPPALEERERELLSLMALEPVSADALAHRSGLGAPAAAAALLSLELKGHVRAWPGGSYSRMEASASL
jgi:DNA processing protein